MRETGAGDTETDVRLVVCEGDAVGEERTPVEGRSLSPDALLLVVDAQSRDVEGRFGLGREMVL